MNTQPLATRCILSSLEINLPSQTRKDSAVTAEIHAIKHAGSDAGRYSKNLYPDSVLEPAKKQANAIRTIWKRFITPWKDGQGIMLASALTDFYKEVNPEVKKFYALADAECTPEKFNHTLAQAQVTRSTMFRREDYPVDAAAFRRQFRVTVETLPMADTGHIILDCAEDELRIVTESYNEKLKSAQSDAVEHLREEMQKPLQNIVDQLANYERKMAKGDRTRLCDSLVANVEDIAKRCGILNITGNDKLATHARRKVVDQANNILSKLSVIN